jgi:NADH-quinone oxidoreductase subunit J
MTVYSAIFYLLAFIMITATGLAITRRSQVHAVVYLVISFFATALLFYLLGAPLLAVLEVIIYAGAIMVLFLFIIMTLNAEESQAKGPRIRRWIFPIILGAVSLFVGAVFIFTDPGSRVGLLPAMVSPMTFGLFLFENYWIAVEIISFLLFVALVGALYLGRNGERTEQSDSTDRCRDRMVDQKDGA